MDINVVTDIITNVGFPIACVIALGYFAFYIVKKSNEQNIINMEQIQEQSKERENKLYEEIKENRKVNEKAIDTIAHYAEKLDVIQSDVSEIKHDVISIMTKN